MDQFLFDQWQNGDKPFNGLTLHPNDLIPLSSLATLVADALQQLEQRYPNVRLATYHDWHEHDGYISPSAPTSWERIKSIVASDQSLYENRAGDTFVRIAVYSADLDFLFRIYVLDEDEDDLYPGRWGDFDITGDASLVNDIATALKPLSSYDITLELSKSYFDRRHAG